MIRRHNRVVQFVGAETAQGILPVLETLRAGNKGAIITYGVEVDRNIPAGNASGGKESARKRVVKEIIASIDVAADFENGREPSGSRELGRRAFVAVKLVSRRTMSRCIILTQSSRQACSQIVNHCSTSQHTSHIPEHRLNRQCPFQGLLPHLICLSFIPLYRQEH